MDIPAIRVLWFAVMGEPLKIKCSKFPTAGFPFTVGSTLEGVEAKPKTPLRNSFLKLLVDRNLQFQQGKFHSVNLKGLNGTTAAYKNHSSRHNMY